MLTKTWIVGAGYKLSCTCADIRGHGSRANLPQRCNRKKGLCDYLPYLAFEKRGRPSAQVSDADSIQRAALSSPRVLPVALLAAQAAVLAGSYIPNGASGEIDGRLKR
jgi:hypothetical protein